MGWTLAPNVKANLATVERTPWLKNLGTIGDTRHMAGAGDHTPYSTHPGKLGYPTSGQVHAEDVGMSQADLDKFEAWIKAEWRAGRAMGVKYININNRHYNLQTQARANAAKSGRITPSASTDHHLHLSYENGAVDSDLLARFVAYRNAPAKKPAPKKPARKGYPTMPRGFGGPEDTTGDQRYWAAKWFEAMAAHSPGYYAEITKWDAGRAEIARQEIGPVTLGAVKKIAEQKRITWRGAITPALWAVFPPVQ